MNRENRVVFLTSGGMTHYAVLVVNALGRSGVSVDVITSSEFLSHAIESNVNIYDYRKSVDPKRHVMIKTLHMIQYYLKLLLFLFSTDTRIIHFFHYRYLFLDGVICIALIKLMGKKLLYEVHNVWPHNKRGKTYDYLCLKFAYTISYHIICHNMSSKNDLVHDFKISSDKVHVIPIGLESHIPKTDLTRIEAKRRIVPPDLLEYPTLLFFGKISPYKGLEYLIQACKILKEPKKFFLVIAGDKSGAEDYWAGILRLIERSIPKEYYLLKPIYIPDSEMELYFKAADVVILPYTEIYQSFIHMQAFFYGLPVIATDIGSFREDVLDGKMGYVVPPRDSISLANAIERFFNEMFPDLANVSSLILKESDKRFSWDESASSYKNLYNKEIVKETSRLE